MDSKWSCFAFPIAYSEQENHCFLIRLASPRENRPRHAVVAAAFLVCMHQAYMDVVNLPGLAGDGTSDKRSFGVNVFAHDLLWCTCS